MDTEARRIMALSISKLYSSRTQRGGLRLQRSLLLSMTMRAARDIYHAAVVLRESDEEQVVPCALEESMDTGKDQDTVNESPLKEANPREPKVNLEEDKENQGSKSRKRSGKTAVEPDFLPSKKARMDTDDEVFKPNNGNSCRPTETLTAFPTNRAIVAC